METGECRDQVVALVRLGETDRGEEIVDDARPIFVRGCRSGGGGGPGETGGCFVFEQWPLLLGWKLVQGLLALAQTQDLHFPLALQQLTRSREYFLETTIPMAQSITIFNCRLRNVTANQWRALDINYVNPYDITLLRNSDATDFGYL